MFDFSYPNEDRTSLLDQLSEQVRACLVSKAVVRSYKRGETICLQDETVDHLKIVLEGWVKLYRVSSTGNEAVLATLQEGQSFDELAALQKGRSQFSAEAISNCRVMYIEVSANCSCPNAYREISDAVLMATTDHLDQMMDQVEQLKNQNGVQRLSTYLLGFCKGESGAVKFKLPFERVVLAGVLGMKPESLSRSFQKLKKIGVNSEYKSVDIADIDRLRSVSEDAVV